MKKLILNLLCDDKTKNIYKKTQYLLLNRKQYRGIFPKPELTLSNITQTTAITSKLAAHTNQKFKELLGLIRLVKSHPKLGILSNDAILLYEKPVFKSRK